MNLQHPISSVTTLSIGYLCIMLSIAWNYKATTIEKTAWVSNLRATKQAHELTSTVTFTQVLFTWLFTCNKDWVQLGNIKKRWRYDIPFKFHYIIKNYYIAITQFVGQYCNKMSDKMQMCSWKYPTILQIEVLIIQLVINNSIKVSWHLSIKC